MTVNVAVAISTTGDERRIPVLAQCVEAWGNILQAHGNGHGALFVTVDGDEAACERVLRAVDSWTSSVYRVGQPGPDYRTYNHRLLADVPRLGVAANKNTGLELMVGNTPAYDLFLSDDDVWPLYPQSLDKHIHLPIAHSMVCWGGNRLEPSLHPTFAHWSWPRGVMLYATRRVVERVGGMDERFGAGGHEHVEWSNRIHNAGMSPQRFCSPVSYATREGMGAAALWHAEDMPRPGEPRHTFAARKRRQSTTQRTAEEWTRIDQIMAEHEGDSGFVAYRATENGRGSATLCPAPRA